MLIFANIFSAAVAIGLAFVILSPSDPGWQTKIGAFVKCAWGFALLYLALLALFPIGESLL